MAQRSHHTPARAKQMPSPKAAPRGKRFSFVQSASASYSTFVDISPIGGTPVSGYFDQNPFTPELTPDFSLNSSVFSTESKRAEALSSAQRREEELRAIRQQSQGVQEYLIGRLQQLENRDSSDLIGLDFYEQELEKMKDSICQRASERRVSDTDLSAQLAKVQRELDEVRKTLGQKQIEMTQQQVESAELKQTLSKLEKTVLDLGGSVELGKVTVEAPRKNCSESCSSTCILF